MRISKRHYIYGSGSHGCLYDYGPNLAASQKDAAQSLAEVFELDDTKLNELELDGYTKLGRDFGADYAEITPCDCNDVEQHLETGERIELEDYYNECSQCGQIDCLEENCEPEEGGISYPAWVIE